MLSHILPICLLCTFKIYNSMLSKKEIPKAFENVFPVLVTSQIVVTNMKIEKSNGVENRINR